MVLMTFKPKIEFPIIKNIKDYKKSWLKKDIVAGVTITAIVVPQSMAYAELAGAPLVAGLYAALVGMLVYAVFTTSRYVNVGPDAALAALAGATLIPLAGGDPMRYAALLAVLALLIGGVCIVAVYAKLSLLADFISRPIMLGYMAGLALAVIASQMPKLFGITLTSAGSFFTTIAHILTHLHQVSVPTLVFSIILFTIALLMQVYVKQIPMSLVVLVGSIAASALFSFSEMGIAVIGDIPKGLPLPVWPVVTVFDIQNLVVPALAIALISYANTISTARTYGVHQSKDISTNQELFGLGFTNIAAGLFSGIPVSASGSRTAVNFQTGAKSSVSQLFGALGLIVVLLFFAPFLKFLPLASLAVIIILAVRSLFNIDELKSIWRAWRSEALLAVITLLGVTFLGIFQGLLLAVMLAVLNLVRRNSYPEDVILGVAENGAIRDSNRPPSTESIPGLVMYRFDAPLYFANANFFKERVSYIIKNSKGPVDCFLWDAETITELDSTAGRMLVELIEDLRRNGIVFCVARLKGPIRHKFSRSTTLTEALDVAPLFTTLGEAVEAYKETQIDKSL